MKNRHDDERVKQIRAIALTAYGRSEDYLRPSQAALQMHVPKLVDEEELTAVIMSLKDIASRCLRMHRRGRFFYHSASTIGGAVPFDGEQMATYLSKNRR